MKLVDQQLDCYLYRNPELYDRTYRASGVSVRKKGMAAGLLARNGKEPPASVLDIGCGTSFKLAHMAELGYQCVGVDPLEKMVSFSRATYPDLEFEVGDIRSVRLNRTFDAITCLGWVVEYLHSSEDIARAMETLAEHSKPGTLLVADMHNPIGDLHARGLSSKLSVDVDNFQVTSQATFDVDRRHQILTQRRTWKMPGGVEEVEIRHFRLFFPREIEHYLNSYGFEVVEMFDNTDMKSTELDGSMLFVVATYRG